jgi:small-conductance mechanosensitive channel
VGRKRHTPTVSFFAFQDIITSVVGVLVLVTLIMVLELTQQTVEAKSKDEMVRDTLSESLKSLEEEIRTTQDTIAELSQKAVTSAAIVDSKAHREQLDKRLKQLEERRRKFESQNQSIHQANVRAQGEMRQLEEQSAEVEKKKDELKKLLAKLNQIDTAIEQFIDNTNLFRQSSLGGRSVIIIEIQKDSITSTKLSSMEQSRYEQPKDFDAFRKSIQGTNIASHHFLILIRPGGSPLFTRCQALLNDLSASYGYDLIDDSPTPATK